MSDTAAPPAEAGPATNQTLTMTLEGVNTALFQPAAPTIIGRKNRIIIEFDPASKQVSMVTEPENSLTPCQVLQLVLSMSMNMLQVALVNEAAHLAASKASAPRGLSN